MDRKLLVVPILLVFTAIGVRPLPAQVDYSTATLKGTIFDPQDLLVAGARVTVSNPSTGWSRVVETSDDGFYHVPLLPPGSYKVQVQASGFATVMANISVSVGEIVSYDIHLTLGRASETVEVSEATPLIQTEQTQQANTIGRLQVTQLPNFSHLFSDSIFTQPGISSSEAPRLQEAGVGGFTSSGFSVGGTNGRSNLVTIDGGENELGYGSPRTPHLPVDSVQEFQVNRSSFAAEFGFAAGTAVNVVTRSGTNKFHGSAHAWFRNEHTDVTNYFAPKTGAKAFEQDFVTGLTFSGPLVKDKVLFFTAYELTKSDTPQFRGYADSNAAKGIRSNSEQQKYVNSLAASGDPVLQDIAQQLQFLLDPANFPNSANLLVPNTGAFNDWKKFHNWVTRLDYQPNTTNSLTVRFALMRDDGSRMYILDPSNAPDDATLGFWRDYTILSAWNHVLNARVINQLRLQIAPHVVVESPVVSPHTAYLRITGLGQFGGEHYQPYYLRERRFQFDDSLTVTRSKHTIKFGASYRPMTYLVRNELWFNGEFQFSDGAIPIVGGLIPPTSASFAPLVAFNLSRGLLPTGDPATNLTALQTYDIGIPVAFRQGFGNPQVSDWEHYVGAYAQDSWKATRNLVWDFGVRVDIDAAASPVPRSVYFSPRLGFAWSPGRDNKTVIRGAGGLFAAPLPFYIGYQVNLLGDNGKYMNQVANSLSSTDQRVLTLWAMLTGCDPLQPWVCTKQPPFPQLTAADVNAAGLPIGPGLPGRVVFNIMQDYKNPYCIQASFSVQRQLGSNMALELAYQMYHGLHLPVGVDTNVQETGLIDPFVGPLYTRLNPDIFVGTYSSVGSSIYHGAMATLTRRLKRGLQFQVNYTFSKAIDDNIDSTGEFGAFRPTRMDLERSVSIFNVKHNFVANAVYTTPFRAGGNLLSHVMADVTISPVLSLRSGIPFTVRVPGMQNGTIGHSLWARPWHAGRNTGIGPNFYSLDMRMAKSFYFNRDAGRRIDFLVQGTNILNHTNFSAVNDSFPANPNPFSVGGQTIDLLNGPYDLRGIRGLDAAQPLGFKAAFDPRQVQFGLKLIF